MSEEIEEYEFNKSLVYKKEDKFQPVNYFEIFKYE
jgi:hypothetical protein